MPAKPCADERPCCAAYFSPHNCERGPDQAALYTPNKKNMSGTSPASFGCSTVGWEGQPYLWTELMGLLLFFSVKYKVDDSVIVQVGRQRNGGWQNMCLVPRLKRLQLIYALVWVCIVLHCVPEPREECVNCWAQDTRIAFKTAGSFYLTAWNPANFIGASSKSHFFSEFFREAGTCEDFPIQAWEKKNKRALTACWTFSEQGETKDRISTVSSQSAKGSQAGCDDAISKVAIKR